MELDTVLDQIIWPAERLLPLRMTSREAEVMLLAIGLQESRFTYRQQIKGPAKGFWQFEEHGGVKGVLTHPATTKLAHMVCQERRVLPLTFAVYHALAQDDILAAAFARLLLWSDPRPLPDLGEVEEAWDLYLRTWRPGKPRPTHWSENYAEALETVTANQLVEP